MAQPGRRATRKPGRGPRLAIPRRTISHRARSSRARPPRRRRQRPLRAPPPRPPTAPASAMVWSSGSRTAPAPGESGSRASMARTCASSRRRTAASTAARTSRRTASSSPTSTCRATSRATPASPRRRSCASSGATARASGRAAPRAQTYGRGNRAAIWHAARKLQFIDGQGRSVLLDVDSGATEVLAEPGGGDRGWLINPARTHATTGFPTFSVYDRARRAVAERSVFGGCEPYFSHDGRWGVWVAGAGGPIYRLDLATRAVGRMLEKNDPRLGVQGYLYFPMPARSGDLMVFAASRRRARPQQGQLRGVRGRDRSAVVRAARQAGAPHRPSGLRPLPRRLGGAAPARPPLRRGAAHREPRSPAGQVALELRRRRRGRRRRERPPPLRAARELRGERHRRGRGGRRPPPRRPRGGARRGAAAASGRRGARRPRGAGRVRRADRRERGARQPRLRGRGERPRRRPRRPRPHPPSGRGSARPRHAAARRRARPRAAAQCAAADRARAAGAGVAELARGPGLPLGAGRPAEPGARSAARRGARLRGHPARRGALRPRQGDAPRRRLVRGRRGGVAARRRRRRARQRGDARGDDHARSGGADRAGRGGRIARRPRIRRSSR